VLETTLASLPTVVIYRASKLTELIAQRLAAVRFVSVPNLLLGRSVWLFCCAWLERVH
jgi:lipid A disaccharide synthetase